MCIRDRLVALQVVLVHYLLLVVVHVPQEYLMAVLGYHPLSDQSEALDPQLKQVPILLFVVQPMELKQVE